MPRIRVGLIGCGVIGRFHATSAVGDPNIDFAAVADVVADAAQNMAQEFGVAKVYSSGEQLLNDPDIDAVVLALITSVRTPLAYTALRAGKHVLLEKPSAANADDLRQMMDMRGDRIVGVCSSRFAFLDSAKTARQIVESGRLGAIRIVRCRGLHGAKPPREGFVPPPWRVSHRLNGGGYLVNWGIYDLNYMMEATAWSLRPRTVMAQTWPIAEHLAAGRVDPDSDAETHGIIMVRCEGGEIITHERGEFLSVDEDFDWQIVGERGSLSLWMLPGNDGPYVVEYATDAENGLTRHVVQDQPGDNISNLMPIRDFCDAILHRRPPKTDLEKALVMQQVIDAAYESARTGKAVQID